MAPIIGITTYGRVERPAPTGHYSEHYVVPTPYVDAVRRAGGVPVMLAPGETRWSRWLDAVDGVVVVGGTDIDPTHYGAARTIHVQAADPERDTSELALAATLVERDLPSLFVCRGMQILNVALGGTLHPHIPDLDMGDIHRDEHGWWAYHDVIVTEGSKVAAAMGTLLPKPCSGHHQALDVVAPALEVTAVAPDGLAEAVELPGHRWLVGVQWHPEVSAPDDPSQQGIFDHLVAESAAPRT